MWIKLKVKIFLVNFITDVSVLILQSWMLQHVIFLSPYIDNPQGHEGLSSSELSPCNALLEWICQALFAVVVH